MTSEDNVQDFLRMYKQLTDPRMKEEAQLLERRKKRIEERKLDTGAYVVEN